MRIFIFYFVISLVLSFTQACITNVVACDGDNTVDPNNDCLPYQVTNLQYSVNLPDYGITWHPVIGASSYKFEGLCKSNNASSLNEIDWSLAKVEDFTSSQASVKFKDTQFCYYRVAGCSSFGCGLKSEPLQIIMGKPAPSGFGILEGTPVETSANASSFNVFQRNFTFVWNNLIDSQNNNFAYAIQYSNQWDTSTNSIVWPKFSDTVSLIPPVEPDASNSESISYYLSSLISADYRTKIINKRGGAQSKFPNPVVACSSRASTDCVSSQNYDNKKNFWAYRIRVCNTNGENCGPWSPPVKVALRPKKIDAPVIEKVDELSVKFNWNSSGDLDSNLSYNIMECFSRDCKIVSANLSRSLKSYTKGLASAAGGNYSYSVLACINGAYSQNETVSFDEEGSPIPKNEGVACGDPGPSMDVSVNWKSLPLSIDFDKLSYDASFNPIYDIEWSLLADSSYNNVTLLLQQSKINSGRWVNLYSGSIGTFGKFAKSFHVAGGDPAFGIDAPVMGETYVYRAQLCKGSGNCSPLPESSTTWLTAQIPFSSELYKLPIVVSPSNVQYQGSASRDGEYTLALTPPVNTPFVYSIEEQLSWDTSASWKNLNTTSLFVHKWRTADPRSDDSPSFINYRYRICNNLGNCSSGKNVSATVYLRQPTPPAFLNGPNLTSRVGKSGIVLTFEEVPQSGDEGTALLAGNFRYELQEFQSPISSPLIATEKTSPNFHVYWDLSTSIASVVGNSNGCFKNMQTVAGSSGACSNLSGIPTPSLNASHQGVFNLTDKAFQRDYLYRLRSCYGKVCSHWRSAGPFSIGLEAPVITKEANPILAFENTTYPYYSAHTSELVVPVFWNTVIGADSYRIELSGDNISRKWSTILFENALSLRDVFNYGRSYELKIQGCSSGGSLCVDAGAWSTLKINIGVSPQDPNFTVGYAAIGDGGENPTVSPSEGLNKTYYSNAGNFNISWTEIPGSSFYNLIWSTNQGVTWLSANTSLSPGSSSTLMGSTLYSFRNLPGPLTYGYRVQGCTRIGICGNWSSINSARINLVAVKLNPPSFTTSLVSKNTSLEPSSAVQNYDDISLRASRSRNLTLQPLWSTANGVTLTLSWQDVGNALSYQVCKLVEGGANQDCDLSVNRVTLPSSLSTTVEVPSLRGHAAYIFKVRSCYTSNVCGNWNSVGQDVSVSRVVVSLPMDLPLLLVDETWCLNNNEIVLCSANAIQNSKYVSYDGSYFIRWSSMVGYNYPISYRYRYFTSNDSGLSWSNTPSAWSPIPIAKFFLAELGLSLTESRRYSFSLCGQLSDYSLACSEGNPIQNQKQVLRKNINAFTLSHLSVVGGLDGSNFYVNGPSVAASSWATTGNFTLAYPQVKGAIVYKLWETKNPPSSLFRNWSLVAEVLPNSDGSFSYSINKGFGTYYYVVQACVDGTNCYIASPPSSSFYDGSLTSPGYNVNVIDAGMGTATTPFLILTYKQLEDIGKIATTTSQNFILGADIDATPSCGLNKTENDVLAGNCTGSGFSPIGNLSSYFKANFDGRGYKIKGLYINRDSVELIGLFGFVGTGAQIKNVGLVNVNITGGRWVGGLAGWQQESSTINNSYVTGYISGHTAVGGLIGVSRGSSSNNYVIGSVSGRYIVGGLVGALNTFSEVSNSYAIANVSVDGTVFARYPGDGDLVNTFFKNASQQEKAIYPSAGGLAGMFFCSPTVCTLTNSYAAGEVVGKLKITDYYVGGVVGDSYSSLQTTTNTFWDKTITKQSFSALSFALTTTEMQSDTGSITSLGRSSFRFISGLYPKLCKSDSSCNVDPDLSSTSPYLPGQFLDEKFEVEPSSGFLLINTPVDLDNMRHWPIGCSGKNYGSALFQVYANTLNTPKGGPCKGFKLARNIDMSSVSWSTSGSGWMPIGKGRGSSPTFASKLDGNGHAIIGLYINRPTEDNVGLFDRLTNSANIIQLNVVDANIVGNNNVGVVAGEFVNSGSSGQTTISNMSVSGLVSGNDFVGGLVGTSAKGLSNVSSSVNVSGRNLVGGIAGIMSAYSNIVDSYATGSVIGAERVGGLVGHEGGGTINNSYATGSVAGYDRVGGLAGYLDYGGVINSYATGFISARDSYTHGSFGGLVGQTWQASVRNSYATGSVHSGNHYGKKAGGLVGYNRECTIADSYATGSVTSGDAGGLVGDNSLSNIQRSYSTGSSSGYYYGSNGGLIGRSAGSSGVPGGRNYTTYPIVNSYWDTTTSGKTDGIGVISGSAANTITGLTTTQMQQITGPSALGSCFKLTTNKYPQLYTKIGSTCTQIFVGGPNATR